MKKSFGLTIKTAYWTLSSKSINKFGKGNKLYMQSDLSMLKLIWLQKKYYIYFYKNKEIKEKVVISKAGSHCKA